MKKTNNTAKGIMCILFSALSFSGMSIFINMSGDVPVMQKVFFRNLVALAIATVTLAKSKQSFKPHKGCIKYHILRSSLGLSGMIGNFYATTKMSSTSDAAMLNKMSPFFTLIFSYIFLKEKFKPKQALAIAIAFAGSLFVIKPTLSNVELLPSVAGFLGGVGAGAAYTCVRHMANKGENGTFTVFFFSAFLRDLHGAVFDFQIYSHDGKAVDMLNSCWCVRSRRTVWYHLRLYFCSKQ